MGERRNIIPANKMSLRSPRLLVRSASAGCTDARAGRRRVAGLSSVSLPIRTPPILSLSFWVPRSRDLFYLISIFCQMLCGEYRSRLLPLLASESRSRGTGDGEWRAPRFGHWGDFCPTNFGEIQWVSGSTMLLVAGNHSERSCLFLLP